MKVDKSSIHRGSFLEYKKDPCGYTYKKFLENHPIFYVNFGIRKKRFFFNTEEAVIKSLVTHGTHFHRGRGLEFAKSLIGSNILTGDGPSHLEKRKIVSKIYSRKYVSLFEAEVNRYAKNVFENLGDGVQNLEDFFSSISSDIISILLFGRPVKEKTAIVNKTITSAFELIARMYIPGYKLLMKTPFSKKGNFERSMHDLNSMLDEMILSRKKTQNKYEGTIDLLIDADLSKEEIKSQVLALFLAGHETTSTTLTWLVYAVLRNELVTPQLIQACEKAKAENLTYEQMGEVPEVKSLIFETFRYYPAIWSIGRKVVKDVTINNIDLKPGDYIGLSPYTMHRNPKVFPEPDKFLPKRWVTSDGFLKPKNHDFFPFSLGNRNCIGRFLAETEIFTVVKHLFSNFNLVLQTQEEVKGQSYIALKPDRDIFVDFKRR